MKKLITFLIIAIFPLFGEIIQLKDGTIIKGRIVKQDEYQIKIIDEKGIEMSIPRKQIEKISEEIKPSFQVDPKLINMAGKELRRFRDFYYAGFVLSNSGILLTVLSKDPPLIAGGLMMVLGGAVMQLISHYFVGVAGEYLQEAVK